MHWFYEILPENLAELKFAPFSVKRFPLASLLSTSFWVRGSGMVVGCFNSPPDKEGLGEVYQINPLNPPLAANTRIIACGYKMPVAVDQKTGFSRRVIVTPANINDSTSADDLIMGDEKAVYADKAYDKRYET